MHDAELARLLGLPDESFEAFIFDCDGTLADTMPAHYAAWLESLDSAGFTHGFPEEQFYSYGGVPTRVIIDRLNAQHGTAMDREAVFHAKERAYLRLSEVIDPVVPVAELARRSFGRIPTAVASGGPRDVVETTLLRIGLAGRFNAVVTADDVRHGKPAPDIFLEAARRLGVPPSACLVFEDAEPGRQAAVAAGMRCVMVDARRFRRA
jgi:HAD superfamily hydrolase (TIGR01509 family)